MLPLLMLTDSNAEMGQKFKNAIWIKILGWISVIGLTVLNIIGLPDQIGNFFGDNASATQLAIGDYIAYALIIGILALLIWTVFDLYKGNKAFAAKALEEK